MATRISENGRFLQTGVRALAAALLIGIIAGCAPIPPAERPLQPTGTEGPIRKAPSRLMEITSDGDGRPEITCPPNHEEFCDRTEITDSQGTHVHWTCWCALI